MQVQGVIHGQHVMLSRATGLPNGSAVMVAIRRMSLSLEEKRALIDRLCGAWAQDDSLSRIFEEIAAERHQSLAREVNFDVAA